ncbi:hypothetical protein Nmel_004375 [Mimus melanotis]
MTVLFNCNLSIDKCRTSCRFTHKKRLSHEK